MTSFVSKIGPLVVIIIAYELTVFINRTCGILKQMPLEDSSGTASFETRLSPCQKVPDEKQSSAILACEAHPYQPKQNPQFIQQAPHNSDIIIYEQHSSKLVLTSDATHCNPQKKSKVVSQHNQLVFQSVNRVTSVDQLQKQHQPHTKSNTLFQLCTSALTCRFRQQRTHVSSSSSNIQPTTLGKTSTVSQMQSFDSAEEVPQIDPTPTMITPIVSVASYNISPNVNTSGLIATLPNSVSLPLFRSAFHLTF